MISLEAIEREISELEATRDTSYRLCERLCWLYVCRDHLRPPQSGQGDRVTSRIDGSEFLEVCSDVSYTAMMGVLDEHMSVLKVVQPKEYDALMAKLRALR